MQPTATDPLTSDEELWAEVRRRKTQRKSAGTDEEPSTQPEQQKLVGASLVDRLHLSGISPLQPQQRARRSLHRRSASTSYHTSSKVTSRSPPPIRSTSARATPRTSARSTPVRSRESTPTPGTPSVEIVDVSIDSYEMRRDLFRSFTIYFIGVRRRINDGPESSWLVVRRYSQFYEMHSKLKRLFPDILRAIPFPPKKLFFNTEPKFVEKRRVALQEYLQRILKSVEVLQSYPLRVFLELPSNLVLSPSQEHIRAMVSERGGDFTMTRLESPPPPRSKLNLNFDMSSFYSKIAWTPSELHLSDFEIIRRIGVGGFSEVFLCHRVGSMEPLALKCMKKDMLLMKNQTTVARVKTERDVLVMCSSSPFMVRLRYSFQDNEALYLVMEFMPGGDLRNLLCHCTVDEASVRVYMAQMFMAVHTLHSMGYIHRDLKPENFLIDRAGCLKLTDFGLSIDLPTRIQMKRHSSDSLKAVSTDSAAPAPAAPATNTSTSTGEQVRPLTVLLHASELQTPPTSTISTPCESPVMAPSAPPNSLLSAFMRPTSPPCDLSQSVMSSERLSPVQLALNGVDTDALEDQQEVEEDLPGIVSFEKRTPTRALLIPVDSRRHTRRASSPLPSPVFDLEPLDALHVSDDDQFSTSPAGPVIRPHSKERMTEPRDIFQRGHSRLHARLWGSAPSSMLVMPETAVPMNPTYRLPRRNLSNPQRSKNRVYSVVGSPAYTAVEIMRNMGYGASVDWWSLGVIMYELFVGLTPFEDPHTETPEEIFHNILHYRERLHYPGPDVMSRTAWDLIKRLICEPSDRIGFDEVRSHPFFAGIDWDDVQDLTPPFVPELQDDFDVSYFDLD